MYGCRRGRLIGVMSSQDVVHVPLLNVHGHVHHVDRASTVLGPRDFPSCLRVPRVPWARRKRAAGGRAPLMTPRGLGRGREMSPETPIVPEGSPRGSDEIEFVVRALSG
jgi:hypothetical protein